MHGASHAMGLELEHDMAQGWPVTPADQAQISALVKKLDVGDSDWHWRNEQDAWTFGAVKLTEGSSRLS